jgi:RNA recognition motif-containing protein
MKNLFVSNLSFGTSEAQLRNAFQQVSLPLNFSLAPSKVVSCLTPDLRLLVSETGMPRGSAFLNYEEEQSAKDALGMNSTMLDGRLIVVSVADPNIRTQKRQNENEYYIYLF